LVEKGHNSYLLYF